MSISYVKPSRAARVTPAAAPQAPQGVSRARRELRTWIDAYSRLTAALDAAKVLNNDPMRKDKTSLQALYNQRAAAAAQMARWGAQVLDEA